MGAYDLTLGAYLVGVVMAAILLGVACTQAITYFTIYTNDPMWIKATVIFSLATIWGHQISVTDKMYANTVTYYPDPTILSDIGWGLIAQTWFNAFTAICVQSFYYYRIYILLNKSLYFPGVLFAGSVAQFVLAVIYAVKCGTIPAEEIPSLTNLVTAVNSIGAGLDILIAFVMIAVLLRNRTGFRKTDSVITKLVAYCVNSGLLTSICALGTLLALRIAPNTYIAYPFYFCLGRVYVISLLASLNGRKGIKMESSDDEQPWESYDLSRRTASTSVGQGVSVRKPGAGNVLVSVERHTDTSPDFTKSYEEGDRKANHIGDAI
ncbi:hypothetical protein CYLTODRAFT_417883 [Cylindrobasidium torrendii FP15055 ss-10]|uniref:DUF6534 domain-containing protein n=1 Tax=Cylindrobasidium torrendii FP15055 ss-10 TaxID=1314674 RepID=A0A0D7BQH4_9AGAR|nr:hypothetical protein CYLTODRAFT_417883 [Cylindrobasidium torrendii FP15055 ss-10]